MNIIKSYNESCHHEPSFKTQLLREWTIESKNILFQWCFKLIFKELGDPIQILDLACGKGGDLHKWNILRSKVSPQQFIWHGLDFSIDSVHEANRRLKNYSGFAESSYAVEFDISNNYFINDRPIHIYDICSFQMSLNYFCGSEDQLAPIFQNISLALKHHGVCVMTFMDCSSLLTRTENHWPSIGTHITWINDQQYSLNMEGSISNCIESIPCIKSIITQAREFDLDVIRYEPLNELIIPIDLTYSLDIIQETKHWWSFYRGLVFIKKN